MAAAVALAVPVSVTAQHDHSPTAAPAPGGAPLLEGMGSLHHAVTTSSPLAQRYFDQGLSLAYAFNHAEAKRSFEAAARLDSSCAMCWWGIALVLGPNVNAPADPATHAEAYAAARRASKLASRATAGERDLIAAMTRRYASAAPADRAPLDSAYALAMHGVAARHSGDPDAQALAAEAAMTLSPWNYWTRANAPRPGTRWILTTLEGAVRKWPDHAGACHMYIHAVEAAFPERALACAERLAALMPGAGHLVHMPAHIYLRVGRYDDAIAANEHAVHADESYIAGNDVRGGFYSIAYYPHNHHFLAFAATMAGRSDKAVASARSAAALIPLDVARDVAELQLLVVYPQLTLATFERWDEVLAELMPRRDLGVATGLAWYARGVALAASGRTGPAEAALDSLRRLAPTVKADPGAVVLRIAERALTGEIAARGGRPAEAIAPLTEAMRLEDGLGYMEPPYWHQPIRQRLGAVLVAVGRSSEGARLFREDLARFPRNVWSERGLASSLATSGAARPTGAVNPR